MTAAALAAGLLVGFGLWVVIQAAAGRRVLPATLPHRPTAIRPAQVGAAVAAGVVGFVVTGVVIAGAVAAIAGWIAAGPHRRGVTGQVEVGAAVATWTETVRDLLLAGRPLGSALVLSTAVAPTALTGPLTDLARDIDIGVPVADALEAFGERLGHPTADRVVVALVLAHRHGVGDLPGLLSAQVESLRDEVQLLRDVHAGRANIRRTVQLLLGLFAVVAVGGLVVFRSWFAFYRTPLGQVALAGIALFVAFGVVSLQRLSRPPLPPRFYARTPT